VSPLNLFFAAAVAVSEESRSRRKITSTIFRGKKPTLPLSGSNAINASKAAADYSLDVEPCYITDTHRNAVVDKDSLLLPAFGFRLELGTPLTPEQRAEVCEHTRLRLVSVITVAVSLSLSLALVWLLTLVNTVVQGGEPLRARQRQ
jgi:hypothetical protein